MLKLPKTQEHSYFGPRHDGKLSFTAEDVAACIHNLDSEMRKLGFVFDAATARNLAQIEFAVSQDSTISFDSLNSTLTTASIGTPIQFLQNWLPGFVNIITRKRAIDEFIGMTVSGSWEDEQIVQGESELTGLAVPYSDETNVEYANWNTNFVYRNVVRFEQGYMVGDLEEARAGRMRYNSADAKTKSVMLALEIMRNYTGFYGFNSGNNLTYGFLNDPGLPAYVSSPNGSWASATMLQIIQAILTGINALYTQSGGTIDPKKLPTTLAVSTNRVNFLSTPSDFGYSVKKWLNENYPLIRIVDAPELNTADSGANVWYLYAEHIDDDYTTDDSRVWTQVVPAKVRVGRVRQLEKGYSTTYSNSTAGAFLKRPYAVVRYTGI